MASLINFLNNPNQPQVEDIDNIQVSATGKVIFYKGTTPILALGKVYNLYIDLISPSNQMGIYFVIEEKGWVYKFTFASLTDLNGKSYTAFDTFTGDPATYYAKVVEVYEDLNALFAACCASGGGGGTVDSVTGNIVDNTDPANPVVTQVQSDWDEADNTSPAYIANKPALDFVESVTAGDDVTIGGTATDPTVGVTPNTFVRLAGTEVGFPITGDLEIQSGTKLFVTDSTGNEFAITFYEDQLFITGTDGTYSTEFSIENGAITMGSDNPFFAAVQYSADYSANFTNRSLIDLETLKKRIWTKAGIWDVNDDSTKGFIVGSLLWDTTNSKMYECTDNTAGAAVWVRKFKDTIVFTGYMGFQVPSGSTRYYPPGSSFNTGFSTEDAPTVIIPVSGDASDLSFNLSTAQPSTGSLEITFREGAFGSLADTTLQVIVPANSAAGIYEDVSNTPSVTKGNGMTFKLVNNASSNSALIRTHSFKIVTNG